MTEILVLGAAGQLGLCLQSVAPTELSIVFIDRQTCDVTQTEQLVQVFNQHEPKLIINCVAYTAVDRAESEPDFARQLNVDVLSSIAACCGPDTKLIHISTDFVFGGDAESAYLPTDATNPGSVYGATKLAGEKLAQELFGDRLMIIRTSWLYSEFANNFVKTMVRLMTSQPELKVVDDQVGSPTYAVGLAKFIWHVVAKDLFQAGVYHWADDGQISWFDFAQEIHKQCDARDHFNIQARVLPIPTSSYPTPAARPRFSVLDTETSRQRFGISTGIWQDNLSLMLDNLEKLTAPAVD